MMNVAMAHLEMTAMIIVRVMNLNTVQAIANVLIMAGVTMIASVNVSIAKHLGILGHDN